MDQTIMITPAMAIILLILSGLGLVLIVCVVALMFKRGPSGRTIYRDSLRRQAEQDWKAAERVRAEYDRQTRQGKFTKINGVYRVHQPVDIRA